MMGDLIARLQAATGPSKELDKAIWHALHPGETPFGWPTAIYPECTGSIDAADKLVPEGLGRMSLRGPGRSGAPLYGCLLFVENGFGMEEEVAHSRTDAGEAIAICIAALAVRSAAP